MTVPVIENGFTVRCTDCNEDLRWEGKGRKAVKVCGCAPVVAVAAEPVGRRKCSKKGTTAKGSGEERNIVKAWIKWGFDAYRTAGSGAHGSRNNETAFATDVRVKLGDRAWRIESKRHAKIPGLKSLLNLKGGSEILWVREDFSEPYVLMSADTFSEFAQAKGLK